MISGFVMMVMDLLCYFLLLSLKCVIIASRFFFLELSAYKRLIKDYNQRRKMTSMLCIRAKIIIFIYCTILGFFFKNLIS